MTDIIDKIIKLGVSIVGGILILYVLYVILKGFF